MRLILDYNSKINRLALSVKRDERFDWSYMPISCKKVEADRIFDVIQCLFRHADCRQDVMDFME